MKLHMHFGCETSFGLKLKVSLEALTMELGVSSRPLQQCYAKYIVGFSVGEVQQVQDYG